MAPPGRNFAYEGVPPSFANKLPPPEGEDTNTRAIIIFLSYLTLYFSLTIFIIRRLATSAIVLSKSRTARPPPKKYVLTIGLLAATSLATAWFYMYQYLKISYGGWLMWRTHFDLTPDQLHWGLWLKHTSLFRDLWDTAIIGYARYWWTFQIFFFACGLALDLEQKGVPRGIRHTWAFMLLGQIVSISFATNLFLLAILLSPPPPPPPTRAGINRNKWLGPWIINASAVLATVYSAFQLRHELYWHHPSFLSLLLVPHAALLVLPVLRGLIPIRYFIEDDPEFAGNAYKNVWKFTTGAGTLLLLIMSYLSFGFSRIRGVKDALLEHPAVSMVAFDVIFCWITWITWSVIQKNGGSQILSGDGDGAEKESSWAASGTALAGGDVGGEIRRR